MKDFSLQITPCHVRLSTRSKCDVSIYDNMYLYIFPVPFHNKSQKAKDKKKLGNPSHNVSLTTVSTSVILGYFKH